MSSPLIQSAINFSEGRRRAVIEAIAAAARTVPGVIVADCSADVDHNRMVLSLLGGPEEIRQAALATARVAVREINLRAHTGVHPRLGAVDVVPVVPIRDLTMEACIAVAERIGEDFAEQLGLPVYFYERSARPGRRVALPDIRRGGFEGLLAEPLTGLRAPDLGPSQPHPTAGASVVGARDPLVAFNINLDTPEHEVARRIAALLRRERERRPELTGVRALGLYLSSRRLAQISLNLTRPEKTPLPAVFEVVRQEAGRRGVQIAFSKVIGLIPRYALGGEPPERILWRDYRETQILEHWL